MITLEDILHRVDWSEVETSLLGCYPEQKKYIRWYKKQFWRLYSYHQTSETSMNAPTISIHIDRFSDGVHEFYDIKGINEEMNCAYSLELYPEETWLRFTVHPETLNLYKPGVILAHCLYEMNFLNLYDHTM